MPFDNLLNYRKNVYSQSGQDGIIEYIFNKLNIKNGFFVEFGAVDGIYLSNTRKLFEEGWSGLYIEGQKEIFEKLQKNFTSTDRIICVNKWVAIQGENSLDSILTAHIPGQIIDFCSIDVDGIDVELFESLKDNLPTVICIEGGQAVHPLWQHRLPVRIAAKKIQQSLIVMTEIARRKGYEILCTYQDTFYIKKDRMTSFNVPSDNLWKLYKEGLKVNLRSLTTTRSRMKKAGLRNPIVDYLLDASNYHQFGRGHRDAWEKEHGERLLQLIDTLPESLQHPKENAHYVSVFHKLIQRLYR